MTDVSRETVSETAFTLTSPPERLASLADVPQSPAKVFKMVRDVLHWDVVAWISAGRFAPTLYVSNSDGHSVGDVLYPGYDATIYCVEARDPETRAIGFQAFYMGKFYGEGDKRNSKGSFQSARIADPIGTPVKLWAEYSPIKPSQGKGEIESSYRVRVGRAHAEAAQRDRDYNRRAYWWPKDYQMTTVKEFEKWLAEWASYAPKGTL